MDIFNITTINRAECAQAADETIAFLRNGGMSSVTRSESHKRDTQRMRAILADVMEKTDMSKVNSLAAQFA